MLVVGLVLYLTRAANQSLKTKSVEPQNHLLIRFFKHVVLVSLALFALMVFLGDMTSVRQRYLTPLLIPLPFWLFLSYPIVHRAGVVGVARVAGGVALGIGVAINVMYATDTHLFSYPYKEFAGGLEKMFGRDITIATKRYRDSGNLAIYMPDIKVKKRGEFPEDVVLIWLKGVKKLPLGQRYKPVGETFMQEQDFYYFSNRKAVLYAQRYRLTE